MIFWVMQRFYRCSTIDGVNFMKNTLFILFCLITPGYTAAATAENADKNTVQADSTTVSGSSQYVQEYLDLIDAQEKSHGSMDPQLGEQLLGLGLLYKNLGKYDKASEVLQRSLQIKRVNDGIQNMDQIPVLNALIDVNTAARNWDELNRNYQLLLWVYQRNLEPGDPELLPVIDRVGRWKTVAYANGLLSEDPSTTLADLTDMYQSTIATMEKLYGDSDPRLVRPLKGLAMARYQLALYIYNTPLQEFQGSERRSDFHVQCSMIVVGGVLQRVCRTVEVPNPNYYVSKQSVKDQRVMSQLQSVRHSLNRIVEINAANPDATPLEKADALVNLGDWYFMNNRKGKAFENYKQAYQLLDSEDNKVNIDKLFGRPMRIPFASTEDTGRKDKDGHPITKPYVKLTFTVPVSGKARNIEIIEASDPKDYKIRRLARENIKSALFRPRIEDGEPVLTKKTELVLSGRVLQQAQTEYVDQRDSIYNGTNVTY